MYRGKSMRGPAAKAKTGRKENKIKERELVTILTN